MATLYHVVFGTRHSSGIGINVRGAVNLVDNEDGYDPWISDPSYGGIIESGAGMWVHHRDRRILELRNDGLAGYVGLFIYNDESTLRVGTGGPLVLRRPLTGSVYQETQYNFFIGRVDE